MIEINKKSFFGYSEDEVKHYLNDLEKDYTQQISSKRQKLREIIDKNNEIHKHLELVSNESNKINQIANKHSKTVNDYIKEINGMEKELSHVKLEEDKKRMMEYSKLTHKAKEFSSYCDLLSLSYIELTAFIKKYKVE